MTTRLQLGVIAGALAGAGATALAAQRLAGTLRAEQRLALDRAAAAERELASSRRDREQFAAVAAHDLSEPLRTVTGFLELLERRYGDRLDDRGRDLVGHALDGTDRMQRLVDGLLDLSRAGRPAPLQPVELADVVRDACAGLRAQMEAAGATVTADDDLPTVLADAPQLARALQNLVSNAVKFARPHSPAHVRISCAPAGDRWCLRVADGGVGIPAESRERVFEMFHRLRGSEQGGGAGIGLAVVQGIVSRHGGRTWIEETPGGGTTVALTLAAAPPSAALEDPEPPPEPEPVLRPAVGDLAAAGD